MNSLKNSANVHDWLNEHGDYLYRFALARLREPHQAEDVVQETFLAAIKSTNFAQQSSPRTWLTGILKHKIIDVMRAQLKTTALVYEESVPDTPGMEEFFEEDGHWAEAPLGWNAPEGELEQKQFLLILQGCMDKLPKKLAALFMMREVIEEDNETICKELGITTTNAWVMLYRARMGLRKCLEIHWLEV